MIEWIDEVIRRSDAGEAMVICTLVRTRGSTPQKEGAVMIVLANGQTLGTIGGGCVEAEVKSRALAQTHESGSKLLTFDLNQDYGWDDGLVCGGRMQVAVQAGEPAAVGDTFKKIKQALDSGNTATHKIDAVDETGKTQTFEQRVEPPPRLIIAGGGHVGLALAELAGSLGFRVTVVDDRRDIASPSRFPEAQCVVGPIDRELHKLTLGDHDYVVIVTRGHRHDGQALAAVIGRGARYVGLIGSKHKINAIFRTLLEDGSATQQALDTVHAPIGLEIGAVSPAEIAISIAAQLIAERRQ